MARRWLRFALNRLGHDARGSTLTRRIGIVLRKEKRKGAASAFRAFDPNFPAEDPRQLAADREAKPGSTVFAARAPVCLLERLEDRRLFVRRNSDPAVAD